MSETHLNNLSMEERPHLVILGAGASRAAFPNGDGLGRAVPVMADLISLAGIGPVLDRADVVWRGRNFEELFSELRSDSKRYETAKTIEEMLWQYFSEFQLPSQPCLYDHLLSTLRAKDVVASFNWDPFLIDACRRTPSAQKLPHILFLHGCVRCGMCATCQKAALVGNPCDRCGAIPNPVPLLYPVADKDYTSDPFIAAQWNNFRIALSDAYLVTIFGYAAPVSDTAAVAAMKTAWAARGAREFEQIEIIDIALPSELVRRWKNFIVRHHFEVHTSFYDSRSARHPRRACEACWDQFMEISLRQDSPIPRDADFSELFNWLRPMIEAER